MENNFTNLKGTYDYLPNKQVIREHIKHVLQSIFIKYGFAPIETPILCMYDLLASKYSEGADILNETYKLSDQGQRKLGLRYDLTITFSKLISSSPEIVLPFKRYEIGKVFRDGPIKVGRNREFTQCDIDVVGIKSLLAEAEYFTMIVEAFNKLDLEVEIDFNNRKLLTGLIKYVIGDISDELTKELIMIIDKFAKMSNEDLLEEFEYRGVSAEKYNQLRTLLSKDYKELSEILSECENELIIEGLKEVSELYSYIEGTEAIKYVKFTPYLARGIDIYTGTVWEIFLKDRKILDKDFNLSIGGGGRYDKIISEFIDNGNEYPAVGMSFGLDVIYEVLKIKNESSKQSLIDLFVIPMDTEAETFKFVTKLRESGVKVDFEKNKQKLKKSLNYANNESIPYVIVIGENEISSNQINIKNMATGENTSYELNNVDGIKEHILNSK